MVFIYQPVDITRDLRNMLHLFGEEENSSNINLIQRNNFVILYGRDAIFYSWEAGPRGCLVLALSSHL